ncbi:arginine esterase isoform X3 [Vulpes lagopus]|uniref:arginine esterase isoform X3 n=1 Tax=Vulpes lagopus TaxID=494514 RepID=UPI001BC913EE|nr:arginine esterase isoform X3 [Vulpes lagopus]XP_041585117.1 arginine esterase isoform X3 [Vulpes lagopus]
MVNLPVGVSWYTQSGCSQLPTVQTERMPCRETHERAGFSWCLVVVPEEGGGGRGRGSNYEVWLGRYNLLESENEGQLVKVRKGFIHPLYKKKVQRAVIRPGEDRSHDLMLLHLAEPAKITKAVRVMDLPKKEPPLGSTCYVSGWGSTDPETNLQPGSLQCVDLKLLSNNQCAKVYTQKVTKFMLCAGVLEGKKDTCKGDSGGPLICDGVLVGITSWGATPCGKPQMPSLYTRVMPHLMWIKDTMKANT